MIKAVLPYPPSANRYWRQGRNGRVYVSEDAKVFKGLVWAEMFLNDPVPTGPVLVTIQVYRPRKAGDIDNRIKVLLDAMQGHAYADDKQVASLFVHRYEDKKNPRVEVMVTEDLSEYQGAVSGILGGALCQTI